MTRKHPAESKSFVEPSREGEGNLGEADRKKMELGDAMEHEQGEARERNEEDVEEIDEGKGRKWGGGFVRRGRGAFNAGTQ